MVAGTTGSHSGLCAKLRGPARYKCCKPPSISRPTACIAPQRYPTFPAAVERNSINQGSDGRGGGR